LLSGVSLLTQLLYGIVFVFRYLDLFSSYTWSELGAWHTVYNVSFKLFYLSTSFYLVFLIFKVYPRTRERERAWKLGMWSTIGSLVLAPFAIMIFERKGYPGNWFMEVS
jgi:hypothetical protein